MSSPPSTPAGVGTRGDVVLRALEAMAALGARAGRVEVLLGPAVCGACYEVPEDMQREVAATVPDAVTTTRWGTPGLDLRAGLRARLAGRVARTDVSAVCTRESPDLFSHRRDGVTGRTAGVVRFVGVTDAAHRRARSEPRRPCATASPRRARPPGGTRPR